MNILSVSFIFIFIGIFIIYWSLDKNYKLQNLFLLTISYILYASWDLKALGLLFSISLISYCTGLIIGDSSKNYRKILLYFTIILNIGTLFLFKYYNFFISELYALLEIHSKSLILNLALPIGISFYIFTTTGYVIDIYKQKRKAESNIISFLSFVSFFPLIMSGPIERSTTLLPQFSNKRQFSYSFASEGLIQVIWGFFKKLVIADNCATIVNQAFSIYEVLPASSLCIGAVMYSFQIYFDFSGYSDIAIGFSKLLGFKVLRNFHYPYIAINISDFWRRWHMSLQRWFTDYIYFPLGGSKCSKSRCIYNTFVVFTICGIWHGANWTFIAWGLYNAFLFIPYILFTKGKSKKSISDATKIPTIRDFFNMTGTFILVTIGWIIFNSSSISDAIGYMSHCLDASLFSIPTGIGLTDFLLTAILLVLVLLLEWFQKDKEFALLFKSPKWIKLCVIYIIIYMLIFNRAGVADFIYLQF